MDNSDFVVSKLNSVDLPYWASPLIRIDDKIVSFAGEVKGQKIAAIGFDLHNSDFPLTLEFPVFINNLISYLVDRDTMSNTQYNCGEGIDITPLPEAEKIYIKGPDSEKTEVSSKYPIKPFEETFSPGIYEISQKVGDKEIDKLVAVNFPVSESGPGSAVDSVKTDEAANQAKDTSLNDSRTSGDVSSRGGINLLNILLLTALLVITVEWIVYVRQYRA
jgi:hypothetical protein